MKEETKNAVSAIFDDVDDKEKDKKRLDNKDEVEDEREVFARKAYDEDTRQAALYWKQRRGAVMDNDLHDKMDKILSTSWEDASPDVKENYYRLFDEKSSK